MTVKVSKIIKCPNCGKPIPWVNSQNFKPFCSERCKLIDFDEWVMEEKVIPGDETVNSVDLDESLD